MDDGSETNLRSKVDFYTNDYGLSLSEFVELIKKTPTILERAIKTNVEPKVYYLRLKNKIQDYAITSIAISTTSKFTELCNDPNTIKFNKFKENWIYLTSNRKLKGIQNLGLDKERLDYTQLTNYTKTTLQKAYTNIVNDNRVQDLQANPNLIFNYV